MPVSPPRFLRPLGREGMSFLELIISIAILTILAAAVIPGVGSGVDHARVERSASTLDALAKAIVQFKEKNVGKYPGELDQLTTLPASTDFNSCWASGKTTNQFGGNIGNQWQGPYIDRFVPSTGFPLPIGTANNQLVRNPTDVSAGGQGGTLQIVVPGVSIDDVYALNEQVDGDGTTSTIGQVNGTVRWSAPGADGYVTLYYAIPTSGC